MKEERGDEISEESLSVRRRSVEHSMLGIFGHCDESCEIRVRRLPRETEFARGFVGGLKSLGWG